MEFKFEIIAIVLTVSQKLWITIAPKILAGRTRICWELISKKFDWKTIFQKSISARQDEQLFQDDSLLHVEMRGGGGGGKAPFTAKKTLRAQNWKKSILIEIFKLDWKKQSRLKFSIPDLQNSPQKIGGWRVARLKISISIEIFNLGGRSWFFSIFGPLGEPPFRRKHLRGSELRSR